ncbi:MAG: MFS transporter [Acidimicrobiales bacterium]
MTDHPEPASNRGLGADAEPGEATGQVSKGASERRDLSVAVLVTTLVALPVFLVSALAVQIRESLHFSIGALGLAITLYYFGAAVASVPLGRLTERVGGIRVMRAAMVMAALLLELLGGIATSWAGLVVLLVVAGMVSSATATATNVFLARRTRPVHLGRAFGIKQAAVPLATVIGGLAVPAVAVTIGWRWAFVIAGLGALATSRLIPDSRISPADRRRDRLANPTPQVVLLPLIVLATGFGLGIFAAAGLGSFMVTSAVTMGFAKGTAGLIAALAGAAAVGARVASGIRADRRGRAHFPVVAFMLATGSLGYGALAISSATHTRWLFVAGAVVALGAGWGWNGLFNFAVVRTHIGAPARATGVVQVGGRLGGMLGPVVVGVVVDHWSYTAAWLVASGASLVGAGAVIVGRHLLIASRRGETGGG